VRLRAVSGFLLAVTYAKEKAEWQQNKLGLGREQNKSSMMKFRKIWADNRADPVKIGSLASVEATQTSSKASTTPSASATPSKSSGGRWEPTL
jgi:hypothetical protein